MRVVAGTDIGSLYTKVVILGNEASDCTLVSSHEVRSGGLYKDAGTEALHSALQAAGLKMEDVDYIVSTGYGRYQFEFGDKTVSELQCHARGIKYLFPEVGTLIDIGGQDSKIIHVNDRGKVWNFLMNDKCAAGTGRFLEVMADGLGIPISELSQTALRSTKEVGMSSVCTVFAESEVIGLLSEGCHREDIVRAIYRAIADRVGTMVIRLGVREKVAMSGGVARHSSLVSAMEERLKTKIFVPQNPELVGAWGAALIAMETVRARDTDNVTRPA